MSNTSNPQRRSGIERLIPFECDSVEVLFAEADDLAIYQWSQRAAAGPLEVWQLVALHSCLDPASMGDSRDEAFHNLELFCECARVEPDFPTDIPFLELAADIVFAVEEIGAGVLHAQSAADGNGWAALVGLNDFFAWSIQRCLPVLAGWNQRGAQPGSVGSDTPKESPSVATKWPWGSHETELLRALATAGVCWRSVEEGGNYDPAQISTAPTNQQVEALLEKHGVGAVDMRKAIARILRPKELRPGPRPLK